MSDSYPPKDDERARTREAVRIIRRLDENPEDESAKRELEAFLARGAAEQSTYDRSLRAMGKATTTLRRDRSMNYAFALLGATLITMALAWKPFSLYVMADFQSGNSVEEVQLASGDTVILDASSAIIDETEDGRRAVTLLAGAGYFDVDTSQESFVVHVGDAAIETLGTVFEVSRQGPLMQVSVAQGAVQVSAAGAAVVVQAGERIRWQDAPKAKPELVERDAVAAWRVDQLITDGMTVGEVAAIIDRRFGGAIVILSDKLDRTVVSGRLDLSRPEDALRTLAASVDARIHALQPFGALLRD